MGSEMCIRDSLYKLGFPQLKHLVHDFAAGVAHAVPFAHGFMEWLADTVASGLFGLLIGFCIVAILHLLPKRGSAAH